MKYRIEITSSANADIESAYCYIRDDSPENAITWREGFYVVADTLSRFPEGCGLALENDYVDFEVRQTFYGRYRILFTIEGNRVIILKVRHGARRSMRPDELTEPDDIT